MKIYWNVQSVPELADLSPNDRSRLWRSAYRRTFKHWQTWLAVFTAFLVMAIAALIAVAVVPKDLGSLGLVYCILIGGIPSGLAFLFFNQVTIHMARPHLAVLRESSASR